MVKTILQGTIKGESRQGRQRKRWEHNIREWTGLEFAKSQRAVENREKWRKLVAKSASGSCPMSGSSALFISGCNREYLSILAALGTLISVIL